MGIFQKSVIQKYSKSINVPEVKIKGLHALYETLDGIDFIRFLKQYENGYGDFTDDRNMVG